jgi:hypothetical protein
MKNTEDIENNDFNKIKSLQKQLKKLVIKKQQCKLY